MATRGEYLVGIDFNPSKDDNVSKIKRAAADLIDLIDEVKSQVPEAERLKALAITHVEDGAMWAVKAATKRPQEA